MFSFKFRPVNDNPYLHLPDEEEDEEEDIEMNQMYVSSFILLLLNYQSTLPLSSLFDTS